MLDATFARPDLTTFARLDELGLQVTGQRVEPERAVLACRVVEPDRWCRRCGCEGVPRDTVPRRLEHEPLGWRPATLLVTVHRYRCTGCGHVWRQDTSTAAEPRAKLSRRGLRCALQAIVCQRPGLVDRASGGLATGTMLSDPRWNRVDHAKAAETPPGSGCARKSSTTTRRGNVTHLCWAGPCPVSALPCEPRAVGKNEAIRS